MTNIARLIIQTMAWALAANDNGKFHYPNENLPTTTTLNFAANTWAIV